MTTNAQKRVQVARDVIEQLNTKQIISNPGRYFAGLQQENPLNIKVDGDTQVKAILEELPPCKVCALGACFVAMMRRYNEHTVRDLIPTGSNSTNYASLREHLGTLSALTSYLSTLFSADQIKLIEVAYEGARLSGSFDYYTKEMPLPVFNAHKFHMSRASYQSEYPASHFTIAGIKIGHRRNDDGSEILKDIMKNIIRNKGEFKP